MEYRPHSGSEQCKYFCLYKFSFINLKFLASPDFQCVFAATRFKGLEDMFKRHNAVRWDPPVYTAFCIS